MTGEWYWDDVKRMIFVLKDGKHIELSEKAVKGIRCALILKAVRGT